MLPVDAPHAAVSFTVLVALQLISGVSRIGRAAKRPTDQLQVVLTLHLLGTDALCYQVPPCSQSCC